MGRDGEQLIAFKRSLFDKVKIEARPGEVISYKPHKGQHDLHFDPAWKVFVVSAGQRSGKTLAAALEVAAVAGIQGSRTWIVAPNYDLVDRCFSMVYDFLVRQQILGPGSIVKKSMTKDNRYIETAWGSWIRGKSAENPDSLVGEQLDFLVVDEAARIGTENVWIECLQPRLVNRQGRALLISSPRGYNWFDQYWKRALSPEHYDNGWRQGNFSTSDNPYVDPDWLDKVRSEVPEHVWNQEYLGIPQRFSGLIWPDYRDKLYDPVHPGRGGHLYDPAEHPAMATNTHYRAIDVGYRHPTFCLWAEVDGENNVWIYDEYSAQNIVHEDHAEAIAAQTPHKVLTTWISPDAKRTNRITRREDRLSAWEVYRKAGIVTRPAHTDVNAGLTIVARYMRATLEDQPEHPKMLISLNCRMLRQALMEYVYAEHHSIRDVDAPEKPRKYQDDACDALRYLLATQPRFVAHWQADREEQYYEPPRPRLRGQAYVAR